MKKIFCLLCASIMIFLLCSCNDNNKYETMKTNISKDYVSEFMELLGGEIELGGLSSGLVLDEEHCFNVTPQEVATETDMKIFKFSDSCVSFVVLDNKIYELCDSFGGYGFVNAIPCDFDNDGNKDLLVASSWGSGMHRSIISVFNSVTKKSTVIYDTSYTDTPNTDLIVSRSSASLFTDIPDIDEKLYFSVLSVKIDVENNNLANLSYVVDDIEGHIEVKDGVPTFIPYQK